MPLLRKLQYFMAHENKNDVQCIFDSSNDKKCGKIFKEEK